MLVMNQTVKMKIKIHTVLFLICKYAKQSLIVLLFCNGKGKDRGGIFLPLMMDLSCKRIRGRCCNGGYRTKFPCP